MKFIRRAMFKFLETARKPMFNRYQRSPTQALMHGAAYVQDISSNTHQVFKIEDLVHQGSDKSNHVEENLLRNVFLDWDSSPNKLNKAKLIVCMDDSPCNDCVDSIGYWHPNLSKAIVGDENSLLLQFVFKRFYVKNPESSDEGQKSHRFANTEEAIKRYEKKSDELGVDIKNAKDPSLAGKNISKVSFALEADGFRPGLEIGYREGISKDDNNIDDIDKHKQKDSDGDMLD